LAAVRAVLLGLSCTHRRDRLGATIVLGLRDFFEMLGANTQSHSAKMIESTFTGSADGNVAVIEGEAMRPHLALTDREPAVSALGLSPRPQPASLRLIDAGPEPLVGGFTTPLRVIQRVTSALVPGRMHSAEAISRDLAGTSEGAVSHVRDHIVAQTKHGDVT
jgi:hypothetical protein